MKPAIKIIRWFDRLLPGEFQVTKIDSFDGCRYVCAAYPDRERAECYATQLKAELGTTEPPPRRERRRVAPNGSGRRGAFLKRQRRVAERSS